MAQEPCSDRFHHLLVGNEIISEIFAGAGGSKDPDPAVDLCADVSRVLESFPRAFQKEAVLRVKHRCIARR